MKKLILYSLLGFIAISFAHSAPQFIQIANQSKGTNKTFLDCNNEFWGTDFRYMCKHDQVYEIGAKDGRCIWEKSKLYSGWECLGDELYALRPAYICKPMFIPQLMNKSISYWDLKGIIKEYNAWRLWCEEGQKPSFKFSLTKFRLDNGTCTKDNMLRGLEELSAAMIMEKTEQDSAEQKAQYYVKYENEANKKEANRISDNKSPAEQQKIEKQKETLNILLRIYNWVSALFG